MKLINKKLYIKGFTLSSRASSLHAKRGFTLIEIMVSVAIFTIIIVTGMGALVTLTRSYQITQDQKRVHDGLNYALETITREIRLGKNYRVNATASSLPGTVLDGEGSSVGFFTTDNRGYVIYSLNNGVLMANRSGATNAQNGAQPLTDESQVVIKNVRFTVLGTDSYGDGNYQQPLIWVQVQAYAVNGDHDRITTIQTLVSQRTLDI